MIKAGSPKVKVAVSQAPSSANKDADSASKKTLTYDTLEAPSNALRTPSRKSYVPVVPSPLLQDTTPQPRITRSQTNVTKVTPLPKAVETLKKGEIMDMDSLASPNRVASPASTSG